MKPFHACLFLIFCAVTHAEEKGYRFVFPPFANEDIKAFAGPLPEHPTFEQIKAISVEEWRGLMSTGNSLVQGIAASELLERGDQKTILRLVYSLKQGNVVAESFLTLSSSKSLAAIPYLMEDVGHGSLEYYGTFFAGDAGFGEGRVRVAAVKLVASTLANAPEFTGETKDCLMAINSGRESWIQTLSDESRYLIEWWLLNETAFETGKWSEIRPLPTHITYPDLKNDTSLHLTPQTQALLGPTWELSEPFEAWAARIIDPKRRNLDFVALSWNGKKVVEHPAKSLDPETKLEDRPSRKTPTPRTSPDSESGDRRKGISWIMVATVLTFALSILWWLRRKSSTGI